MKMNFNRFCLVVMMFGCINAVAQTGEKPYWRDSTLTTTKRMPQYQEFLNNNYPFPAKPRNQWEIGLKGGLTQGMTDVKNWGPTGGFGVHIRKALGYVVSLRMEYDWIRLKGMDWQPTQAYGKNSVLTNYYFPNIVTATYPPIFYNYRSTIHELSLQGVFSFNNVRFHRAKTGCNFYLFGGIGAFTYSTFYKTLNSSGTPYDYSAIITQFGNNFTYSQRKDVKKALKDLWTGKWSTMAQRDPSRPTLGGPNIGFVGVFGAGMQFKLNNKLSLSIEDKVSISNSDLVDGQQWQNNYTPNVTQSIATTKSVDSYNFASVGLNINIGKHAVAPLWWLNPLDYAYNEINAPRHMKLPKPVLDDGDGDGVTDQFDLEPNTPKGCPVDSHGVSRDTDGDGVPDCRDKELITPTQCQPVDADGVGKCPEPQCCKDLRAALDSGNFGGRDKNKCAIGDLPSILFKKKSAKLSKEGMALLATAAVKMRENPSCNVAVLGYGQSSKAAQELSWERVNSVISYLVEKEGIRQGRLIFKYGQTGGDDNTIDLQGAEGAEDSNPVAPNPFPGLRSRK
jgi:outer membrane protein OmpA-like peptidoglycan-associated protein